MLFRLGSPCLGIIDHCNARLTISPFFFNIVAESDDLVLDDSEGDVYPISQVRRQMQAVFRFAYDGATSKFGTLRFCLPSGLESFHSRGTT